MRLWMAFLVVLPACGFNGPSAAGDSGGGGGGGGSDATVAPDAQACFGSFDLDKICFTVVPTGPVTADNVVINTDDVAMCDASNDRKSQYCVIAGAGFTLPAAKTIRAFGTKPLVLLSTTTMDLQGDVDVSSNHNLGLMNSGAGANPATLCMNNNFATADSGGFGGSFGGKGGDGDTVGGSRGIANQPVSFPHILRGGCLGGAGNTTAGAGAVAGMGGSGGGAVAIIAPMRIDFNGKINASGAGGLGGSNQRSGGGGGGSGGMIVLDSPSITPGSSGLVFANGGGGAEGGAGTGMGGTAAAGQPGGESTAPDVAALGGASGADGGNGGNGSFSTQLAGNFAAGGTVQRDGGAGGGGGGAGFTRAVGVANPNTSVIAPPSTPP